MNCQSAGNKIWLLERLVCGLPASCFARTPGNPAMKVSGRSSAWMNAGYGVGGALAAQDKSTNVSATSAANDKFARSEFVATLAMTLLLIKNCHSVEMKKAAQKLGGY